jgi:hypothetical protein
MSVTAYAGYEDSELVTLLQKGDAHAFTCLYDRYWEKLFAIAYYHCRNKETAAEQYADFELELDWKLAPQGNSGILYHVTEEYPTSYLSGPEYQLIDDEHFPEKLEDWQKTGANYAMNPPASIPTKPIGSWNHTRIVVNKGHVEHWLNGVKVVEYRFWTDEWKKRKAEGKWKMHRVTAWPKPAISPCRTMAVKYG